MDRIVVCFRWRGSGAELEAGDAAREFGPAARAVLARRGELGGRIVAWHARSFAVDFSPGTQEQAIELLVGDPAAVAERESFGVGVAQGDLECHFECGAHLALASGSALDRAMALAAIAAPGEVLLDPALEAVRAGRLLTRGAQLGTLSGRRIRGLRLDPTFPWRRPESLLPVPVPLLVGPDPHELTVHPGELGLVLAPRGCGGTRALGELAGTVPRALELSCWLVGEPLGALRHAFARADARGGDLDPVQAATLESLLLGEGAELEATGALVAAWAGEAGMVLIDDASEVDADSLDAVVYASKHFGVRVVARVLDGAHVPLSLTTLPRGGTLPLGALDPDEAARLLRSVAAAQVPDDAVARWARRGGGRPLAILEAIRFGFESAELVRDGDQVVPRGRLAGRGGPQPARGWMTQRLRFLDEIERAALDAVAAFGGQARADEIEQLLGAVGVEGDVAAARGSLLRGGWLVPAHDADVALGSATLRDLLHDQLLPERRELWIATAAELLALTDGPLAAGRAAVLALHARRSELGAELGRRAAAASLAVGLQATADAFTLAADRGQPGALTTRGMTGPFALSTPSLRGALHVASPRPSLLVEGTVGSAAAAGDELSGRVADALRSGDLAAMAVLAQEIRDGDERRPLADRLEAMAALRRGDQGAALRIARGVKAGARPLEPSERCRAALTLAVVLGAAGRTTDALLEALEALARAREAADARGEQAVVRFLAQLNEVAGHDDEASAWRSLGASPPTEARP